MNTCRLTFPVKGDRSSLSAWALPALAAPELTWDTSADTLM